MSVLMNRDISKEKKIREQGKEELHKSRECATCKNMFKCKGKPRSVDKCLNYIERIKI